MVELLFLSSVPLLNENYLPKKIDVIVKYTTIKKKNKGIVVFSGLHFVSLEETFTQSLIWIKLTILCSNDKVMLTVN